MTKQKNPEDDVPLTFTGDVNAFEYGGGILYYQPEYNEFLWVFWDGPEDDVEVEDYVYRVYMFRFGPDEDLLADSLSWAKKDIGSIADSVGTPKIELRRMARGTFLEKLRVAEDVQRYWGPENLDGYPYEATYKEMVKRYGDDLNKVTKFGAPKAEEAYEQARRRSGNPTKNVQGLKNVQGDSDVRQLKNIQGLKNKLLR
jgi:hypothetical protein